MARYFSEQTLLDMKYKDMNCMYDLSDLEEYLAGVPTADVVPRAMIEEIFEKIEKALQHEIDLEDSRRRIAGAYGHISNFQLHAYAEDKLDTIKIALSLYKEKYTEGGKE